MGIFKNITDRFKDSGNNNGSSYENKGTGENLFTGSTPSNINDPAMKQYHIKADYSIDYCSRNGCVASFGHYKSKELAEKELKYIKKNNKAWKRLQQNQEGTVKHNPQVVWNMNSKPKSHSL